MIIKAFIFLLVIINFPIIQAEDVIDKISFDGVDKSPGTVLYSKPGRVFYPDSLTADSSRIVEYYQELGWFDCSVVVESHSGKKGIEINFNIAKNILYTITLRLNKPDILKGYFQEISSVVEKYDSKPAVAISIENLANDIIEFYADNGFPYCEIRVSDIYKTEKTARIELTIDINPGPEVTVEKIEFTGRKNLEYSFLQTYTNLKPPLLYSSERFKRTQRRLSLARFIEEAGDYSLFYSKLPKTGVIIFPVRETSPLIADGALGYSSKDDNFYGQLSIAITNILGSGRSAGFDWSKKDKHSSHLKVSLSEPYLLGAPYRMDINFYQDDRDSLFIENGGSIGIYYILSDIYTYGVAIGLSWVNPESYGKSFFAYKEKRNLSLSFSADTRDYPANPTRGDYFFMKGVFIQEKSGANETFAAHTENYRSIEFKTEKYLPLKKNIIIFGGVFGKGDFSSHTSFDRLFGLGGHGSLRGYNQDFFFVSRAGIASLECRLLTSKNGRAYIFSDLSVFQLPVSIGYNYQQDIDTETKYKAGYGVGIAVPVKAGITTVEMSVPHDEGLTAAKLHFGLRAGF